MYCKQGCTVSKNTPGYTRSHLSIQSPRVSSSLAWADSNTSDGVGWGSRNPPNITVSKNHPPPLTSGGKQYTWMDTYGQNVCLTLRKHVFTRKGMSSPRIFMVHHFKKGHSYCSYIIKIMTNVFRYDPQGQTITHTGCVSAMSISATGHWLVNRLAWLHVVEFY